MTSLRLSMLSALLSPLLLDEEDTEQEPEAHAIGESRIDSTVDELAGKHSGEKVT